jgi:hypothetical protein
MSSLPPLYRDFRTQDEIDRPYNLSLAVADTSWSRCAGAACSP